MPKYIGIEAGGTKMICGVSEGGADIQDRTRISTTTPEETIAELAKFIQKHQKAGEIDAIGIASFGPLELNRRSAKYGCITATPKPGWRDFNFVNAIRHVLDVPIGFDTDVNAAALGEHCYGAGRNCQNVVYATIGTGIGGGAIVEGKLLHGALHPEMGHLLVPLRENENFPGVCQYHGNCLEGLASGPSMKQRWQVDSALDLAPDHEAWDIEADYLARFCANIVLCLSPEKIILGGGVMRQKQLFPKIRQRVPGLINGYIDHPLIQNKINDFIVAPGLGENSGIVGAIALAVTSHQARESVHGIK